MRIGIGYDFHRLVKERKLFLGGVEIPYTKGLEGHSDADVVLHAICDALLGAAGFGDIGQHFPDYEPKYKGISSKELLKTVNAMLEKDKWRIGNIDIIMVMEEPKISPFREKIRVSIAETLNIDKEKVNIKATTTEGVGALGRGEAIAAQAAALLEKG
ncbi:MAG: 2-C-methyl-D-erythritol 2,4-cyclodiphosphate synthase [Candidatus Omnitrophota bacterium]